MKHDWKLECTIDEFVDMVIGDNPSVKHLASMLVKLEDPWHDMGDVSADECAATVKVLESEIHSIFRRYQDSYKLGTLMNPHLRAIRNRQAKWLAAKFNITEVSARQLKNIARSKVWNMLSAAEEYLLVRAGSVIPDWSPVYKDIKKYFKEDK